MRRIAGFALATLLAAAPAVADPSFVAGFDAWDMPYFPVDVQLGDLDGDLHPDLVALCGSTSWAVVVRLNPGDGTFGAPDTTTTGFGDALVLADLDGDGALDVLVHGGSQFSYFHGNGDGTLGTRYDFGAAADGAHGVAVADVDGDGDRDVVLAVMPDGLHLYRNTGSGAFAAPVPIATGGAVADVVAGRWNADARPDLAVRVHHPSADSLAVLLNDGAGNFAVTQVAGATYGTAPFTADVDRDGDEDIVTPVEVFTGHGDGVFDAPLLTSEAFVAAGELEPDGPHAELLSTSLNRLHVWSTLAGPPLTSSLTPEPVAPPADGWRIADLDLDGRGDVVGWLYSASAVTVHHGRGLGTFGDPNASPVPAVSRMELIRSNGDALPDVVTQGQGWFNDAYVVPGSGPHAFGAAVTLSVAPDYSAAMAVGDVDGDLDDDVVLTRASGGVSVFLGHGDGSYDAPVTQALGGVTFGELSAGDLNGDGRADLAGFVGLDTVAVALASAGGVFGAPVRHPVPWYGFPTLLRIVEATGDAHPDVVALSRGLDEVAVLPGNGSGALAPAVLSHRLANATPHGFAVGRLDGDAIPDLAVVTDFRLERLLGGAGGTFAALPLLPTVRGGTAVAIADLDLDGDGDIALASQLTCAAHVYVGDGSGALGPGRGYGSGGLAPTALQVADMDGNGRPDLVLGNSLSSDLSVLLGLPLAAGVPGPYPGGLALRITPNPAGGALMARFTLPASGDVRLEMLDLQGRRVAAHAPRRLAAGPHTIEVADGSRLAAGLYWVRLTHAGGTATRSVVVVH